MAHGFESHVDDLPGPYQTDPVHQTGHELQNDVDVRTQVDHPPDDKGSAPHSEEQVGNDEYDSSLNFFLLVFMVLEVLSQDVERIRDFSHPYGNHHLDSAVVAGSNLATSSMCADTE